MFACQSKYLGSAIRKVVFNGAFKRSICACEIPKSYKGVKIPKELKPETWELIKGCLSGSRAHLSRSITLLESERWDHAIQADYLLDFITSVKRKELEEKYGKDKFKPAAFRLGITGPPGAGKSTLVEALGKYLTKKGFKIAVLCIDPSSILTGGSLLGDKTRMIELSVDPNAYVRPSPSNGDLGGVTEHTADLVLLTESVGYDFIIVETVGLGQSEVVVDDMVDMFMLVMPPTMGDSLQGVKKGIMEHSDAIVINKIDMVPKATVEKVVEENAKGMAILGQKAPNWNAEVLKCSAMKKTYMDEIYSCIERFWKSGLESGEMEKKRKWQYETAMWSQLQYYLTRRVKQDDDVTKKALELRYDIQTGALTRRRAASKIATEFLSKPRPIEYEYISKY